MQRNQFYFMNPENTGKRLIHYCFRGQNVRALAKNGWKY